jgi:anti-anti-sigma factor
MIMAMETDFDITECEPSSPSSATVIAVRRQFNEHCALNLLSQYHRKMRSGCRHLLLDLTETEMVGSSGLGAIVYFHQEAVSLNGRFLVICHREALLNLFRLTHLDRIIRIVETREQAWRILENGGGGE